MTCIGASLVLGEATFIFIASLMWNDIMLLFSSSLGMVAGFLTFAISVNMSKDVKEVKRLAPLLLMMAFLAIASGGGLFAGSILIGSSALISMKRPELMLREGRILERESEAPSG